MSTNENKKEEIKEQIALLESRMTDSDFWLDKNKAQQQERCWHAMNYEGTLRQGCNNCFPSNLQIFIRGIKTDSVARP